jgi:hypothetical protein
MPTRPCYHSKPCEQFLKTEKLWQILRKKDNVLTSPRGQAFLSVKLPVPVAEKEKEKEMETEKETERKKEREKETEREKELESPQQCLRKSASGGRGHYSKYDA